MVSSPAYSGHKTPYTTYGQDESNDERQRRRQKYQNRQSELRRSEIRQSELRHEVLDIARSLRVSLRSDSASRSMLQDPASAVLPEPPRYGDLSHYAIRDDDEKCLWELEVTRLIDSLGTAQEPLSTSHGNVLTSAVDTSAFNSLGRLSDQMICALSIYGMDDTVATATSPIDSVGGRSYNRLQERLGQRPELAHVVGVRDPLVTRFRHSERHSRIPRPPMQQETQVQGDPVPLESLNDDDAPTYYALVDYITTILVRLLLKGCDRRHVYWLSIVLTTLAKISTKLKVLSHDLPIFVEQSLDRFSLHNHNYLDALEQTAENPHVDPPLLRQEMKDVTTGIKDNYIVNYVSDMTAVSNWLFRLIWHILTDLNTRNTRGRTTDEFDISASVLTLGSRSLPTLAYQNRPGHISGSSSIVALEMYQRAFDLMIDTVKGIRWNSVPIEQVTKGQCTLSIGVDRALPNQSSEIKSMTEIVSIMVLVSCMDPSLTEDMVKVCSTVRASNVLPKVSNTVQKYAAFFSFRNVPVESNLQPLQNSRPLSQSFILKSGNVPISVVPDRDNAPSRWEFSEAAQKDLHKSESMRRHVSLSARGWAVDEQAISVSCLKYTVSIMVGCSILVLGGLMAGLFVGSRIDGVDPFNLTMFAWIIAGFIILVSKSLRVGEWNWRDFLKGRVTCRTVHELASVTNLDEQGIIMQLLSSEKEWPLISRGPYNSAFSNTGADGFSVDVKPKIGTLFVSGLLVLEVLMESGPALVCLDIRPHITAGENNEATEGAHRGDIPVQVSRNRMVHAQRVPLYALACKDVPQQDEAEKDIVFRQQWVTWEKIIGLYNNTKQSVR